LFPHFNKDFPDIWCIRI